MCVCAHMCVCIGTRLCVVDGSITAHTIPLAIPPPLFHLFHRPVRLGYIKEPTVLERVKLHVVKDVRWNSQGCIVGNERHNMTASYL